MDDYIRSQSMAASPVTNNDLVCRNCVFKGEAETPTGYCDVFTRAKGHKPNSVLLGGDCPYHMRESNGKNR